MLDAARRADAAYLKALGDRKPDAELKKLDAARLRARESYLHSRVANPIYLDGPYQERHIQQIVARMKSAGVAAVKASTIGQQWFAELEGKATFEKAKAAGFGGFKELKYYRPPGRGSRSRNAAEPERPADRGPAQSRNAGQRYVLHSVRIQDVPPDAEGIVKGGHIVPVTAGTPVEVVKSSRGRVLIKAQLSGRGLWGWVDSDRIGTAQAFRRAKGYEVENAARNYRDPDRPFSVGTEQLPYGEGGGMSLSEAKAQLKRRPLDNLGHPNSIWKFKGELAGHPTYARARNPEKWIGDAIKRPGAATRKAKRAGEGVEQWAREHRKDKGLSGKQARLALTLEKIARRRKGARNPTPIASFVQGSDTAHVYKVDEDNYIVEVGDETHPLSSWDAAKKYARLKLHELGSKLRRKNQAGAVLGILGAEQVIAGPQSITGRVLGKLRKRNPEQSAVQMYGVFHGFPGTQILQFETREHVHEWLWAAGTLTELVVVNQQTGARMVLKGPDPDQADFNQVVYVAFNEAGTQAYFVGGDQSIPIERLVAFGLTEDDFRDHMELGRVTKITYQTRKKFERGGTENVDFYHSHGKEHAKGVLPILAYKPLNPSMELVGGRYKVLPPEADLENLSPGIGG